MAAAHGWMLRTAMLVMVRDHARDLARSTTLVTTAGGMGGVARGEERTDVRDAELGPRHLPQHPSLVTSPHALWPCARAARVPSGAAHGVWCRAARAGLLRLLR
jgi:hypothetical protein